MSDRLRSKGVRRVVVAAVLGGFLPMTTAGCFGTFQLTRKVYEFNKEVSPDKWVRWLTFLVLNVFPVYGFATLFDVLFANSVEFWTGKNPVIADLGTQKVVVGPNGEVGRFTMLAPGRADLEIIDAAGRLTALELIREASSVAAYDPNGRLVLRVGDRDGRPAVLAGATD
jgi:hypothetical protein